MTPSIQPDELLDMVNDGSESRRESPEEPQTSQVRTYGDNNTDLPEALQNALLELVQEAQRQDMYQRRIEVISDRKQRFYERGIQHIYYHFGTGAFIQGAPGAIVPAPDGQGEVQCGQYVENYNIFARALQIIIARLSENPVGVDFQADQADKPEDLQAAEAAEAFCILYDRNNNRNDLVISILRMMGLSGRVVTWTRTIADEQKFGTDEADNPKRVQITTVYGKLESKVPIMAQGIEHWPYCILTEDPHVFEAKMDHPKFADKIVEQGDDGIADTQFERMARIGALQGQSSSFQITDTYNYYLERKFAFFRPMMFVASCLDNPYEDEGHLTNEAGDAWTLRDALHEAFPDGAQCTFIGQQYVASRNCCMDDELRVGFPYAGDGMSRPSIMDPAIPIQDDFNDDRNNFHQAKIFGWPSTWLNEDYANLAAINSQEAAPYCFRAPKDRMNRGMKMSDYAWREPDPSIPASFSQDMEWMVVWLLQFILAIPSAFQGQSSTDQKTASGYSMAIQQALGQQGVIWRSVVQLMSEVYQQAAVLASKDNKNDKPIVIPGPDGQKVTVSLGDLGKGKFHCHPDIDSGYPESTVQKRGTFLQVLQIAASNPILAQALFQSPDNWDFFARTMGIPEITLPEAKSRRKQIAEIELLLAQEPVEPQPEAVKAAEAAHAEQTMMVQAGGPPPAPFDPMSLWQPSIQPDELDYHDYEFEECREFLSDWSKVQQQIAAKNQLGVLNVKLHALAHQKFMAAQMAAQAAAMPAPAHAAAPARAAKGAPEPAQSPKAQGPAQTNPLGAQ